MSEVRAITNLIGNTVATVVVARWDNALDLERARIILNGAKADLQTPPPAAAGQPEPMFVASTYAPSERY
jgi:aerobic C4-dicarboxylate transport protein